MSKVLLLPTLLIFIFSCGDNITLPTYYEACDVQEQDCDDDLACYSEFADLPLRYGMCSRYCNGDCPSGLCIFNVNDTREQICFQRCRNNSDCREYYKCRIISFQPWRTACLPITREELDEEYGPKN